MKISNNNDIKCLIYNRPPRTAMFAVIMFLIWILAAVAGLLMAKEIMKDVTL